MKTVCIMENRKTLISNDIQEKINGIFADKSHNLEFIELEKDDLTPCIGCLSCLTKYTGVCINKDLMYDITKKIVNCGMMIYLTPVLFGNFSSTIKNAIDRSGILCKNKSSIQVIIGYGDDINDEEKSTFIDLTVKHRGNADIVHTTLREEIEVFVSRSVEDNKLIFENIINMI